MRYLFSLTLLRWFHLSQVGLECSVQPRITLRALGPLMCTVLALQAWSPSLVYAGSRAGQLSILPSELPPVLSSRTPDIQPFI